MQQETVLNLSDVWFEYVPGRPQIKGFSMRVDAGESVVLMGNSGSGKSTVARLACGLLKAHSGQVERVEASYVAQDPEANIVGQTVWDDVSLAPAAQGLSGDELERRIDEALDAVGLLDAKARPLSQLSGGEIQRVAVAGALAASHRLLILDEPTSHLAPTDALAFWQTVRHAVAQRSIGVLHITHNPWFARMAHRLVIMAHGALVMAGSPRHLLRQPQLMKAIGLRDEIVEGSAGILQSLGNFLPFPAPVDMVVDNLCFRSQTFV